MIEKRFLIKNKKINRERKRKISKKKYKIFEKNISTKIVRNINYSIQIKSRNTSKRGSGKIKKKSKIYRKKVLIKIAK